MYVIGSNDQYGQWHVIRDVIALILIVGPIFYS